MSKSINAWVILAGCFEEILFIDKDVRNYIDRVCHLKVDKGGADGLRFTHHWIWMMMVD